MPLLSGIMPDSRLIGRSSELTRLRALAGPGGESALVVLGEAGIGKSALLADLAGHGAARGIRVLSAVGSEQESSLPFAGLQQLIRPVLDERPAPEELRAALGLYPMRARPDLFRIGTALVELLARQSDGVLVLVDDAHWMDSASLQVLAFTGRRLSAGPITMAYAATGDRPPAALGPGLPELRLGPLSAAEAALLLQVQPDPVGGSVRAQVLTEASGNPQALIELSRAGAGDPAAGPGLGPRPAAGRLTALFAAQLGQLPSVTRHAVLLVAAAGDTDRDVLASVTGGLTPEALAPAEELGLITVNTTGIRFRHPLLRSAVYYDASFAARAAIHRQLADVLAARPDRRAWHLGAAALLPHEDVASLLAASAGQAERRGGPAAMALILERAADLSPEPADQAGRLIQAAEAAVSAGQADWARDLADRALERSPDRCLRLRGQLVTAWALVSSGHYLSATEVLLPLARAAAAGAPAAAWNAIGLAATAAYQSGHPGRLRAVAATIAALPPAADDETQASRLWAMTVTGQARAAGALPRQPGTSERALHHAGAAAWLADETADAIRLLRAARNTFDDQQLRAASGGPLAALGWAYLDAGRWDDALELAAEAGSLTGTGITSSPAILITATIAAARGDTEHARALVADALAADVEHGRLVTARARHALGLCALADGDDLTAFGQLGQLFDDDGLPCHPHASYLAIGDLALAAARCGHRLDGRKKLKQINAALAEAGQPGNPRLRQLMARANGILADPSTLGAYSADVLDDRTGNQWPFECAQFDLEFGEWLRRRRRINEAKPVLGTALKAFRALKARPWERRTESELRACGIALPGALASASGLNGLTPQQRQIIRLAAGGLSNREIAQRLYLSPRTVASHLYRSFPKLGVAGRHQLHDLIPAADRAASNQIRTPIPAGKGTIGMNA
jgi:DNA-binding CsgD family transcriptional regulator/tetratricopeptide (TPR) repeat protein